MIYQKCSQTHRDTYRHTQAHTETDTHTHFIERTRDKLGSAGPTEQHDTSNSQMRVLLYILGQWSGSDTHTTEELHLVL